MKSPLRCAWRPAPSWGRRCRRGRRSGRHSQKRPYDTEGLSLGISDDQRLAEGWSIPYEQGVRERRLPTMAGLAAWLLAAGLAFEGQTRAASTSPEDARPWLIAAALLGFVGIRLLEIDESPLPLGVDSIARSAGEGGLSADNG